MAFVEMFDADGGSYDLSLVRVLNPEKTDVYIEAENGIYNITATSAGLVHSIRSTPIEGQGLSDFIEFMGSNVAVEFKSAGPIYCVAAMASLSTDNKTLTLALNEEPKSCGGIPTE